jgi:hypothetical protein
LLLSFYFLLGVVQFTLSSLVDSRKVQTGDTLECAFIAEPEPILLQIRDVAVTDQQEALVFKGMDTALPFALPDFSKH